jgi:rhamnosyl/mannosyltransferase
VKVLQLSKFYPPVLGGIETVAWELAEGLNRVGVATDVLCAHQQPRGSHQQLAAGAGTHYDVWRTGSLGRVLSTSVAPSMPWRLRVLAPRYDIFHVHMPDPMAAGAFWAARPRGQLVVHWHSDVIRQRVALRAYRPLQDWLLARADAVIATSEPYARSSEDLARWQDKLHVIPIGISDNRPLACSARAGAIRQRMRGRRIVFSLGRMTYYKGFDVLIEAAAELPDDVVVLVGGEGELLDTYRHRVAKRGLAGKVQLLGHIADHELPSHFEACDVFCMPSTLRAEAYGVAIVEAMVMGKPVVATDIPGSGVPWVNLHDQTGLNVPVREPRALAAALRALLDDGARRERLGRQARQRYLEHFHASLMTERVLTLYHGLRREAARA